MPSKMRGYVTLNSNWMVRIFLIEAVLKDLGGQPLGLSPGLRQTVKTLGTVRWNSIVLRTAFPAGVQPAKE